MRPDTKQKVLLALYTEYQRDLPVFDKITAALLGMNHNIFNMALKKLLDEKLIADVHLIWGEEKHSVPMGVVLSVCKLTRLGIDYVERNFNINSGLPGEQKVMVLMTKFADWRLPELSALAASVLAELKQA